MLNYSTLFILAKVFHSVNNPVIMPLMAQRKFYRHLGQSKKKKRWLFLLLKVFAGGIAFCFIAVLFLFIYYAGDLPRPEKFTEKQFVQSTKIYDSAGRHLLYEMYGEEKRTIVSLEIIPEHLKKAVLAAEDTNFYRHWGVDFKGILRAILADLKLWEPAQGASTIPQQLIRSAFLTREKTLERKTKEIILALELSSRYSKDQILEWYLNQIPFGSNAYGVEAASQTFFQKSVKDITLTEAALLVALIKAPSHLSPYGEYLPELLGRKDYILQRMAVLNYITADEAQTAQKEELKFARPSTLSTAPHFVMFVKEILENQWTQDFLRQNGLKVWTSLDWHLQQAAERIIQEQAGLNKNYNAFNASLVAIDPKTGYILAMVGSKDWFGQSEPKGCTSGLNCLFDPKINVALQPRQPGSAFKPFAYLRAFQKGYTPKTMVWDVQTNFGVWGAESYIPHNYDGRFRGPLTLREALAQSINVASVKVLYLAGVRETIKLAKNLGITTLNEVPSFYGLSLVLGGGDVKLLDITSAYGVFATEGLQIPPVAIIRIEDSRGNVLYDNKKTLKRVLGAKEVRWLNHILSDNAARAPIFGWHSPLFIEDAEVAVKTGTTQKYRDGWTIGYTPSLVVGVWAGNNDGTSMFKEPGMVVAGPIWNRFMKEALGRLTKEEFVKPEPLSTGKPVLDGVIQGHSILHYVMRDEPQGPVPSSPWLDPQYNAWERGIIDWALTR